MKSYWGAQCSPACFHSKNGQVWWALCSYCWLLIPLVVGTMLVDPTYDPTSDLASDLTSDTTSNLTSDTASNPKHTKVHYSLSEELWCLLGFCWGKIATSDFKGYLNKQDVAQLLFTGRNDKGSHRSKNTGILWNTFIKQWPAPPYCIYEILFQILPLILGYLLFLNKRYEIRLTPAPFAK